MSPSKKKATRENHQAAQPPPSAAPDPPPSERKIWRNPEEPNEGIHLYRIRPELFTMRVHGKGRFEEFCGTKLYIGGWRRWVDCARTNKMTMSSMTSTFGRLGLFEYYYRRPSLCLKDGLVHLRDEADIEGLNSYTMEVDEIDFYVVKIEAEAYKDMLLKEMYASFRKFYPTPTIVEISDEEAIGLPLVKWDNGKVVRKTMEDRSVEDVQGMRLIGWHETDASSGGRGDTVEVVFLEFDDEDNPIGLDDASLDEVMRDEIKKVVGDDDSGMDGLRVPIDQFFENLAGIEDIGFSHEFIPTGFSNDHGVVRQEDVGAEPEVESVASQQEDVGYEGEAWQQEDGGYETQCSSGKDETLGCYATEKEALEDLGPVLNMQDYVPDEGDVELFEELDELEDFEVETEEDYVVDPELRHNIIFNRHRHLENPVLIPNMIFGSTDDFKRMIKELAVQTQRPLRFRKNEKTRVRADCSVEGCPWVVLLSRYKKGPNFSIKTIKDIYTCGSATKNKMVNVKYLAHKYVSMIRRNPAISLQAFMGQVSEELGVEINNVHAWRAIRAASRLLYGNEVQQFAKTWSYAEEIRLAMPGSTVRTKLDESKFERIYICLAPLKAGFRAGYRKFICLDGCFLKGGFKGQLLAAVGCDPDNGIYPIAWAIVEVENTSSWTWFVQLLKEDLQLHIDAIRWILMTDQQKNAIADELPLSEHRLCVKHLHVNWSKRFAGITFKELMWEASKAANEAYFLVNMEKIKNLSQDVYDALDRIPRHKWTRYAFKTRTNYPMLVNNWAEAFNKVILRAREQPILSLLTNIHSIVVQRLHHEYKVKSKWRRGVCPRVHELLREREKLTWAYLTRPSGTSKYAVTIDIHRFVVDIATKECSCGQWQLSGVPCIHAVCVCLSHNKDPRDFVHNDYSTSTFLDVYSHFLLPIWGLMNWPKTNYPDIIPPNIRVLPGRPKKRRRIDASEARERMEKAKQARVTRAMSTADVVYKAGRKGSTMRCSKCGGIGHNTRTCGRGKDGGSSSQAPNED